MGQKGFEVLKKLIDNSYQNHIQFVVGAKDPNVLNDYYDEILSLSEKNNINFANRTETNSLDFADYTIAIGWRWIISNSNNLIVLHDSLLPKYRGFNPLVTALINGDKEVGVTALFATNNYDEGDIILQKSMKVEYPIKIVDAIEEISKLYAEIVLELFLIISENRKLNSYKQNNENATYSLWRDEEDYHVNWRNDANQIERFINAVSFPYKGAYSLINGVVIRIENATAINDLNISNRTPGKVIFVQEGLPIVVCGKGLLKIFKMKTENGELYKLKSFRTRFK